MQDGVSMQTEATDSSSLSGNIGSRRVAELLRTSCSFLGLRGNKLPVFFPSTVPTF